jgi:hypothetical protein
MFAPADDAEMVCVFRQISGQFAVCELVAHLDLIHGKRQGMGEIPDKFSVLAFVGKFDEVAPQGIGYGLYFLIGFFNNVHSWLSATLKRPALLGALKKTNTRYVGLFAPGQKLSANLCPGYRYSPSPTR